MIYFCNNFDYSTNWAGAYHYLNSKYQHLALDYTRAIQLRQNLKKKIQNLARQNQELKNTKAKKNTQVCLKEPPSLDQSFEPFQKQITIKEQKKEMPNIKKQPSAQTQTKWDGQSYQCTYENCLKVYSSPVSMNLHIKMKHNGGTKKERQAYARIIIEAEQRGQEPPKMNINLPPNFLQEYKTSYQYSKKYSM